MSRIISFASRSESSTGLALSSASKAVETTASVGRWNPTLRAREDLLRRFQVRIAQAVTDVDALRREKRVRHPAADDERIDAFHQVEKHADFVFDLRPADRAHERLARMLRELAQRRQLRFHQEARRRRKIVSDAFRRCVRAMCGAEGVVHVEVAERRERFCKGSVVRFLFGMEAHVFEQHDVAIAQSCNRGICRRAHTVVGKGNGNAQTCREFCGDGAQRERGDGLAVGPSQMRQDDRPCAVFVQIP